MPYEIGYALKDATTVSIAYCPDASEAIKTVRALKLNIEELRFIRSPTGLVIGIAESEAHAAQGV